MRGIPDSRLRGNDVLKKGGNLSTEDVAAGFTDYVIWNRFRTECLDINGELPMECGDSGIVLLMDPVASLLAVTEGCGGDGVLKRVLELAYGNAPQQALLLIREQ